MATNGIRPPQSTPNTNDEKPYGFLYFYLNEHAPPEIEMMPFIVGRYSGCLCCDTLILKNCTGTIKPIFHQKLALRLAPKANKNEKKHMKSTSLTQTRPSHTQLNLNFTSSCWGSHWVCDALHWICEAFWIPTCWYLVALGVERVGHPT